MKCKSHKIFEVSTITFLDLLSVFCELECSRHDRHQRGDRVQSLLFDPSTCAAYSNVAATIIINVATELRDAEFGDRAWQWVLDWSRRLDDPTLWQASSVYNARLSMLHHCLQFEKLVEVLREANGRCAIATAE